MDYNYYSLLHISHFSLYGFFLRESFTSINLRWHKNGLLAIPIPVQSVITLVENLKFPYYTRTMKTYKMAIGSNQAVAHIEMRI